LGLVLARHLASQGARVAICARDEEELERGRLDIEDCGGLALGVVGDVSNPASVDHVVNTVRTTWGPIDVLINNAGIIQVGSLQDVTVEDFQQALNVHFWGSLYTTLAVLPDMMRRRNGRIVNIASIGGKMSVPHLLPYSASKFALVGLSDGLRAELLQHGIYVTTVCPGLMRTGSHLHAQFKGQHRREFAWFSVGASAPVIAMHADRAAAQILQACRDGRAHVVLSLPAKLASWVHGLAPSLTADTLGQINRILPRPGGIGTRNALGRHSRPSWLPGWLTRLGDNASRHNNEVG
jgi:short-subunit dehydrogenase